MSFPVSAALAAELDRINATVEESFQAGDMARLVKAAYTKDGKALPPGSPPVSGHANLSGMFQAVKDSGVARVQLRATERYACDSSAQPQAITELGAYTFYSAQGDAVDEGKYLVVWHAGADGSASGYRYAYDMFSTNKSPA